jgi:hypothetical protein
MVSPDRPADRRVFEEVLQHLLPQVVGNHTVKHQRTRRTARGRHEEKA